MKIRQLGMKNIREINSFDRTLPVDRRLTLLVGSECNGKSSIL